MFKFFRKQEQRSKTLQELLSVEAQTASGMNVNAETAQTLPAVLCAVTTISEAIATLPIHMYNRQPNGDKERSYSHYAERLLNTVPNGYQTAYDFKIALLRSVLLRGNGYALIDYDGSGKPSAMHWLHPDSVIVKKLNNNRIGYQITLTNGKTKALHQEEVLHIKHMSDDGIIGKSPIQVARESIGLGLAMQSHGAHQFKNGLNPSGVLETDNIFKDQNAINRLKEDLAVKYTGTKNSGRPLVLENGLKWKPITFTNADAEWLESRNFTVQDVARIFKLSPLLLGDLTHGNYSNFSEAQRAFLSQTLRPWLTNLQAAFTSRLIATRNQSNSFIEFETKDLLRASTEERFSAYDVAIRNGIMNPNEARAAENMQPRLGGDEYSQSWLNQMQNDMD